MSKETNDTYFVVTYRDTEKTGKTRSIKVRSIEDSSLGLTFVALSDFIFNSSSPILDPSEDYAKQRFQKTKCLHLSIYNIICVEEVGDDNKGIVLAHDKSNIVFFNPEKTPE